MIATVTVPATTANLGPGFDCIGAALSLYNRFKFTLPEEGASKVKIAVTGEEADKVVTDENNLAYRAFVQLYQHIGQQPPPVEIEIELGVPLARGLGSSATAIVGGLLGAYYLAGKPLDIREVREIAIAIEGHSDNVIPALVGGCQVSALGEDYREVWPVYWHHSLTPVVGIPDFELSTEEARKVLPDAIPRADAVFNIARMGMLICSLDQPHSGGLDIALNDRIHHPYRKSLIPGYDRVREAVLAAKAYGMVISGAGPTLLAIADKGRAEGVAAAMKETWQAEGVGVDVRILALDTEGAIVEME
ncbi:MAG: homoserine kinase [Cyanobacteriota bacterium]|nr:homoserine kinase [Cyanobacteriota bacterium]